MAGYVEWLRRKVGSRKVFLVFTVALVRDVNGHVLLQHRTDTNRWGLPGGALEVGETFRECVIRETAEETGLQVQPVRLVGLYCAPNWDMGYPNGDQVQQFTAALECKVVGGQLWPNGDGAESSQNRYFPLDQLPESLMPWHRAMLHDLQRNSPTAYYDVPQPDDLVTDAGYIPQLRSKVGPDRIISVGSSVIIQNQAGEVLLGLRDDTRTWGMPAGALNLGETPATAAIRETREEMGLEVRLTQLAAVSTGREYFHTYPDGNQIQAVGAVFRAEIVGGRLEADQQETLEVGWFPLDNLPPLLPSHADRLKLVAPDPGRSWFK